MRKAVPDIAKRNLTPAQKSAITESEWLTDRQRAVFEPRHKRGWKIVDVAAGVDVSGSTVICFCERMIRE